MVVRKVRERVAVVALGGLVVADGEGRLAELPAAPRDRFALDDALFVRERERGLEAARGLLGLAAQQREACEPRLGRRGPELFEPPQTLEGGGGPFVVAEFEQRVAEDVVGVALARGDGGEALRVVACGGEVVRGVGRLREQGEAAGVMLRGEHGERRLGGARGEGEVRGFARLALASEVITGELVVGDEVFRVSLDLFFERADDEFVRAGVQRGGDHARRGGRRRARSRRSPPAAAAATGHRAEGGESEQLVVDDSPQGGTSCGSGFRHHSSGDRSIYARAARGGCGESSAQRFSERRTAVIRAPRMRFSSGTRDMLVAGLARCQQARPGGRTASLVRRLSRPADICVDKEMFLLYKRLTQIIRGSFHVKLYLRNGPRAATCVRVGHRRRHRPPARQGSFHAPSHSRHSKTLTDIFIVRGGRANPVSPEVSYG